MHVRVEVTEDDLWRFARRELLRHPASRRGLLGGVLAAPVLVVVITSLLGLPTRVVAVATVAAAPLTAAVLWRSAERQTRSLLATQPGLAGTHEFEVGPDGLRERTSANDTLTAWHAIDAVLREDDAIYLTLGPGAGHVLPRRCFDPPQAADAFADEVERHRRRAREPR